MTRAAALFAAVALAGCAPELGEESQSITGGAEEFGYPSVCALVDPVAETIFCTCTYLGTNGGTTPPRVLTAAHCVYGSAASEMKVAFGHSEAGWDEVIPAIAAVAHPDYKNSFSSTRPSDIAFVDLASAPSVAPFPANAESPANADSMSWRHIGFGADHKEITRGIRYRWAGYGVKRSVMIATTAISDSRGEYDYKVVDDNGDGIGEDTCYGDSGGPATALFGGEERVVGVTSRGASDCLQLNSTSIDTRVDTFIGFLQSEAPPPVCNSDGVCAGEEDCSNCPGDCAARAGGKPQARFCCGDGIAQSAEGDGLVCDGNY